MKYLTNSANTVLGIKYYIIAIAIFVIIKCVIAENWELTR